MLSPAGHPGHPCLELNWRSSSPEENFERFLLFRALTRHDGAERMYVVTGPVRYGQIDVRVRARSARGVRDLDIIWTHFGGVDTSVYQGGQYTGNLPPPLFGVDGHKNY